MDYQKIKWEVVPENLPQVYRNCPKCGEKTSFVNTEKFRVNANGRALDVWLIYQCEQCKSTWKLTIYERIKPESIDKSEYQKLLANDKELAATYGFNKELHDKNKAEWILDEENYHVVVNEQTDTSLKGTAQELELICKYPFPIRLDKLLSMQLNLSRTKIKAMYESGLIIFSENEKSLQKCKLREGMIIRINASLI